MISRIMKSWLHWRVGSKFHFCFHRDGNCWRLIALPERTEYRSGQLICYTWWRLSLFVGCLLACIAPAAGQQFVVTDRQAQFVVTDRVVTPPVVPAAKPAKQWFLASEPWCAACPAAKAKFLAKGWPESNILTIAEVKARFGFDVPHVPFEFPEDYKPATATPAAVKPPVAQMSHSEMVATHNRLHGGGQWTWPGDLATHLRETHGVSTATPASQPVRSTAPSGCPGGSCPTQPQRVNRGGRGLFGWRR